MIDHSAQPFWLEPRLSPIGARFDHSLQKGV